MLIEHNACIVFITDAVTVNVVIDNVNDNYPDITTDSMQSIRNTNTGDNDGVVLVLEAKDLDFDVNSICQSCSFTLISSPNDFFELTSSGKFKIREGKSLSEVDNKTVDYRMVFDVQVNVTYFYGPFLL